jgi:hypothetical protein
VKDIRRLRIEEVATMF